MELSPLTLAQLKETNSPLTCILSTSKTLNALDHIGYKLASGDSILTVKGQKVLYLDRVLKSVTYSNEAFYMANYNHLPLCTIVTTILKPKELK